MGDVSMIARRLLDGHVQYGWSGNGGCLDMTGAIIQEFYQTPEEVEYLFSLGQLKLLYLPYSEKKNELYRTSPTGQPHWLGTSEQDIFSKILFVDYAYLYETSEKKWYFADPIIGFVVKVPLQWCVEYMENHMGNAKYLNQKLILLYIDCVTISSLLKEYDNNGSFVSWCSENGIEHVDVLQFQKDMENISDDEDSMWEVLDKILRSNTYKRMTRYFDSWAIFNPDTNSVSFLPKTEKHIETIDRR